MSARIMVVEDDIVSGEALREKMRDLGFEPLPLLTTAEEALARVDELRPDLVLMDVRLAGEMDGIEAAGRLTASHDVAVVFMTAYSDDAVLARAKETAGHGYLIKPVRDRELSVTIEMALARHALELRFKAQTRQLDAIFNTVPSILMVLDPDCHVVHVNRAGIEASGITEEAAVGLRPGDVLRCANGVAADGCGSGEDCADCRICAALNGSAESGQAHRNEEIALDVIDGGGARRRFFVLSTSALELQGEQRVLLVLNDVTDEQNARDAMRRVESRFQNLIEGIGEDFVVFSHDARGVVDYVSPSAGTLLGKPATDIVGRPWTEMAVWEPEGVSRAFRALSMLSAGESVSREELTCNMPDGSQRVLAVGWYPVRDAEGHVEGVEGVIQNVTEQKLYEATLATAREQAESANVAKTRFLANMSHEIRTPLNAIVGYSHLLVRDAGLDDTQTESLEVICRSSDHLTALIDDLLEMSKIEAGRNELQLSDFDLLEVLDEVVALFRARAATSGISLSLDVEEGLPQDVRGDQRKVRQVLINMVGNAVKYTDNGGVKIRARVGSVSGQGLRLLIEVADSGCGIAPGELGLVFDPFEQAADGRRRGEGTGLGMPISRAFARLMDGELTVSSEPGVGSVFVFEFVLAPALQSGVRGAPVGREVIAIAGPQRQRHALVVDDLEVDRRILVRLLERVGFTVEEAASGEAAVAAAAVRRPDVVLMDRRMPSMSGVEATRRLCRQHGADLPVVMVSASVMDEDPAKALAAGVDAFVAKPVREASLFDAVARVTGIEFVYDEAAGAGSLETPPPPPDLRSLLAALPGDVRRDLRAAVEIGDLARVTAIVAALPADQLAAGSCVSRMAAAYEYQHLLEVL